MITKRHTYKSAEKFILTREFFGMKLGLQNITEFLDSIGNPQKSYKTIHISGTNGKGSTASLLSSALIHNGYKTGLFTSPHLVDMRERIRVNGEMISKQAVIAFINKHRSILVKKKSRFLNY